MKKRIISLVAGLTFSMLVPFVSQARWVQNNGWYYQNDITNQFEAGWKYVGNKWYYLNPRDGKMLTGLQNINNNWYYLNDVSGAMHTGWLLINNKWYYFDPVNGDMKVGWQFINNHWYYMDQSTGIMLTNTVTPDGYYVNGDGVWVESNQKFLTEMNNNEESYNSTDDYDDTDDYTDTIDDSNYASEVIDLVNKERSKRGLDELEENDILNEVAEIRAEELTEKFSHTRPNGESCFTAFDEAGYDSNSYAGENMASGQRTPVEVMNSWMHSSGHRKNILSEDYTQIGVGVCKHSGTYYWVQNFGS